MRMLEPKLKSIPDGLKRKISSSGEFGRLQMVSKPDTGWCANKDVGAQNRMVEWCVNENAGAQDQVPEWCVNRTLRPKTGWPDGVPARTLGLRPSDVSGRTLSPRR